MMILWFIRLADSTLPSLTVTCSVEDSFVKLKRGKHTPSTMDIGAVRNPPKTVKMRTEVCSVMIDAILRIPVLMKESAMAISMG